MKKEETKEFLDAVELRRRRCGIRGIARRRDIHRAALGALFGNTPYQHRCDSGKETLQKYGPNMRKSEIDLKQGRIAPQKYFHGSPYRPIDYAKHFFKVVCELGC